MVVPSRFPPLSITSTATCTPVLQCPHHFCCIQTCPWATVPCRSVYCPIQAPAFLLSALFSDPCLPFSDFRPPISGLGCLLWLPICCRTSSLFNNLHQHQIILGGFRDQVGAKSEWLTVHQVPKEENLHTVELKLWAWVWLASTLKHSIAYHLLKIVSKKILQDRINTCGVFTASIINHSADILSFPLEPTNSLTARPLGSWEPSADSYHRWLSTSNHTSARLMADHIQELKTFIFNITESRLKTEHLHELFGLVMNLRNVCFYLFFLP